MAAAKIGEKEKMKCGEGGKYGDLKKKTGGGKYDRDHIPSKAALKERAKQLIGNRELTDAEETAIEKWGEAIAIPRQAHIDVSPTYGQTIKEAQQDAKDLASSTQRDVEAMLKKIDEYDANGNCRSAYEEAAKKLLTKDNSWYDKGLLDLINSISE